MDCLPKKHSADGPLTSPSGSEKRASEKQRVDCSREESKEEMNLASGIEGEEGRHERGMRGQITVSQVRVKKR